MKCNLNLFIHVSYRRSHDLRLNITLTPGEGTDGAAGMKEKELTKEEEAELNDEYTYDESSKYLEANFSEPPPSYDTYVANFSQSAFATKLNTMPSHVSDETQPDVFSPSAIPNEYQSIPTLPPVATPTLEATPILDPHQFRTECSESMLTRSDVPQPTTGGLSGVEGKPPNPALVETPQEKEYDEYVKMKSPTL